MDESLKPAVKDRFCGECGAERGADDNFCGHCRAVLRPLWVCGRCGTAGSRSEARCAACGAAPETFGRRAAERRRLLLGAAILAAVLSAIGGLFLSDVARGRHVLSTKDGRFGRAVRNGQIDR